jgi:hypothetical protein
MSVAALVASQDDRDCPAPAPSSKVEIGKKISAFISTVFRAPKYR